MDRLFLCLIRDKVTTNILFMGSIGHPTNN